MKWNVKKKRSLCNNLAADWLARNRNVSFAALKR